MNAGARIVSGGLLLMIPAIGLVTVCIALPLAWMLAQLLANPAVRADLWPGEFRLSLLARTLGYNASAGVIATVLALPAALVVGRGRGRMSRALWVLLPCALMMPSLAYAYGWQQFLRVAQPVLEPLGVTMAPGGLADVCRCILTLAAWLWPIPACLIGLRLRRLDPALQLHAALDGAQLRITLTQLLGPIIASAAVVTLLAMQEFSVYEPTGISVMATEIRMVFDTGAFSSLANPIVSAAAGGQGPDQAARAAAALATSLPLLAITVMFAAIALWGLLRDAGGVATGDWPSVLDAPCWSRLLAMGIVVVSAGIPTLSLLLSLQASASPWVLVEQVSPQMGGSLMVGGLAALAALAIAVSAAAGWIPGSLVAGVVLFLIGGQLLAISLIRILNRPGMEWAYDSAILPVMAYIGRFGWLALAAARLSWGESWCELRDLAKVDGASMAQAARWVVLPLLLPSLLAASLLVGALSLSEVPATVLLSPQNPQVLTTTLMGWVHIARYDAMIQACLLLVGLTVVLSLAVVALMAMSQRRRLR